MVVLYRRRQRQTVPSTNSRASVGGAVLVSCSILCNGFMLNPTPTKQRMLSSHLHIYAPPGSGYMGRNPKKDNTDPKYKYALTEEQVDQICPAPYADTYEPMMEYPGTMRPGKTPENMPYHDLPGLDIDDPDPVPWPHFQEIEWHHQWDPPHDQFPLMEEFIEMNGRWASVEEEAEMRMGMRRGVRERREMEENAMMDNAMVIMDDDEEDEGTITDIPSMMGLGDGVESVIGKKQDTKKSTKADLLEEGDEDEDEDEEDDFLFDLGLSDDDDEVIKPTSKKSSTKVKASMEEEDNVNDDLSLDDDDDDLNFDLGFDLGGSLF